MTHKIDSIEAKENMIIRATFMDGTIKEYDLHVMIPIFPAVAKLEDNRLFETMKVDIGGYGISWNDDLDLDAETIWEEGNTVGKVRMELMATVATQLMEARRTKGITQKQLAEKTGIYQADISKIERKCGNPSLGTLKRLADGLDMELRLEFVAKKARG